MSDMKHTPGPWRSSGHPHYQAIISDSPTGDERLDEQDHREAYGGYLICESVLEANARLIAAAPELLEALEEAVLQIEYMHEKFQDTGTGCMTITRSNAAIAKATGQ